MGSIVSVCHKPLTRQSQNNMSPSPEEIESVIKEKNEAMQQLALANLSSVKAELKIKAARKRLSLARSAEWAITNELMSY